MAAAEELQQQEILRSKKRKPKHGKSKKPNKKPRPSSMMASAKKPKKPSKKMVKLFRKRARDYHSDDEEDEVPEAEAGADEPLAGSSGEEEHEHEDLDADDEDAEFSRSEDEGSGAQRGIMKFTEGCRAFRIAFMSIMKKHLPDDTLGPILSAHKKLVVEKLAEEIVEQKVKGEAKKEKRLAGEKGHVKPASFLDAKERSLISIATKGVVKLFNAVNKAQNPQKGSNPSRFKDAKELAKRKKQAFFSEMQKPTIHDLENPSKAPTFTNSDNSEPGWAPLRDSYMLTSSKLKDWDKMEEPASIVEPVRMPTDGSSDDE